MIFSIDPGNEYSAYSLLDDDLRPVEFGKVLNHELLGILRNQLMNDNDNCEYAIEMVASYGMAVGKTVFETCVWIGRFVQEIYDYKEVEAKLIYRAEEKINLCHSMKAKDSNIRQALIDRFGVVGTKKNKGWFYGVSKDVWSAIATGITFYDLYLKED